MNFDLTPEQQALHDELAEFARVELNDGMVARDSEGLFPRDEWRRCAEKGLLGLCMPEDHGGRNLDLISATAAMEGFGYGCTDDGLAFGLNAQAWAVVDPLNRFGTPEQIHRYLSSVIAGKQIGCFAMTEPASGSDCFALETSAEKVNGGYVLNGTKQLVTFAPVADFAIVFARTDPDAGNWGLSTFVVDRNTDGYTASEVQAKMGLRTVPIGDIQLQDCRVDEGARLGPEGAGASVFNTTQEMERGFIMASQVGAMARQFEKSVDHARNRHQFGQPVGRFQSVSSRVVEMKLRLETCRLLLYKTAWLHQQGRANMLESALTKIHLAESYVESSLDAIRIRGGRGYLTEYEIERSLRDAVGGLLYGGTTDLQRSIAGRLLGL